MDYAAVGESCGQVAGGMAQLSAQRKSRSFDEISRAVTRLDVANRQLESLLYRVVIPEPKEIKDCVNAAAIGVPPYTLSINRLHTALDELGRIVEQLEEHI